MNIDNHRPTGKEKKNTTRKYYKRQTNGNYKAKGKDKFTRL
jgi:hypothetical protein